MITREIKDLLQERDYGFLKVLNIDRERMFFPLVLVHSDHIADVATKRYFKR